jgi:hypothetical protein
MRMSSRTPASPISEIALPRAVVQLDHRDARLRGEHLEPAADVAGPPRRPIEPAEHQAVIVPFITRPQPCGQLGLAVGAEQVGGHGDKEHLAHARFRLRVALGQVAVQFEDRVIDCQHPGLQVGAGPAQADQFAAAQPAQHPDPEHQAQRVGRGGGQERRRLLWRPALPLGR